MKKQILPISILLGCIILGAFLYEGITEKQYAVNAQRNKEYIGKRKMECYDIFDKERKQDKFNNVIDFKYYEPSNNPFDSNGFSDSCRIEYKYLITNTDGTKRIETEYKSY